ncbi:hypothetical protein [Hydrogenophaga sp. BPS33]|uniref:hypothetical protein n=1 Tax=Hydrogenophaga sp. BPS33 TaxID=2651974 RepID=UPI00131FDDD8|nr:hypothetical protein [Hydrogenophaga sp. BPS33]QHE89234.1 hypothetical protein F9K07_30070 [Hydrogenophaga sp. BPS33]
MTRFRHWLGGSRRSCRTSILGGKDEWATIRETAPQQLDQIDNDEREFNATFHRNESVQA